MPLHGGTLSSAVARSDGSDRMEKKYCEWNRFKSYQLQQNWRASGAPSSLLLLCWSGNTYVCTVILLTLVRACAAEDYCSRWVGRFVNFLSNRGCCRYQTWICGYVQQALLHSKSLEWCRPRTTCLRRGPKIIYSYHTRCEIRDCMDCMGWLCTSS